MSERVWKKGAPPHVGWWEASLHRSEDVWRWWNGSIWSQPAGSKRPKRYAAKRAGEFCYSSNEIRWSDYYPENARVPRINPETSMSKNLKTQWRVEYRTERTGKWRKAGLFETRSAARAEAVNLRVGEYLAGGYCTDGYGMGNTRVRRYIKG